MTITNNRQYYPDSIMVQCIETPNREALGTSSQVTSRPPNGINPSEETGSDNTAHTPNSQRAVAQSLATLDLDGLNQQLAQATPQEILAWAKQTIPAGLVQTTSFSMLALTHMLYEELAHPVPVIFLDTLHLFPETLETAQAAKQRYDLDLHTYRAKGASSRAQFATRYGEALWETNIDRFYEVTKVEPLERALQELGVTAWLTGRRRDQSAGRRHLPIFERDGQGRLKINPLANWTRKDIWAYTFKHNVLYNPLHDQGYTSIGDQPLTTPTTQGEDERAGRWRDSDKTECGIHVLA